MKVNKEITFHFSTILLFVTSTAFSGPKISIPPFKSPRGAVKDRSQDLLPTLNTALAESELVSVMAREE